MSSATGQPGQSPIAESASAQAVPRARTAAWPSWLVVCCYVACAFALTWRLWADPAGRMVAGNPEDTNLFAWFIRYSATAVAHGHLPALVTTGLNAPQGINLMWNTSALLPGVLLAPVTLLAGPQTSLTILLTAGFAGSAASLFWVLRRWGASIAAAAVGGAVYGFSPALIGASIGHFQLQFAVLPPLIIDALLGILTGRGSAVRAGIRLGLLIAVQLFIGEEMLVATAVTAVAVVALGALSQPRAAAKAVAGRAREVVMGVGTAVAVTGLICGYPLWVQFFGPLVSRGSPWTVGMYHTYLYAFVTPSRLMLLHTGSSAAAAARYPGLPPEYLAYLGWPLLIVLAAGAIGFCRDPKIRLAAVTFALLELFAFGDVAVTFRGIRYPAALLPWHWLAGLPVLGDVVPDRFSILADAAAGALLAFAFDRARAPAPRTGRGPAWGLRGYLATAVVVLAVLPLVPLPLPVANVSPASAGWQAAFARLGLAADAHVLVIPDVGYLTRWQAETGVPSSMVGGGDFIDPTATGQATSYVFERRPTALYLTGLWEGTRLGREPSLAQIRDDLAYWRLAAIVTATSRNSRLGRFLVAVFGPPTVQVGDVLVWRSPSPRPPPGRLSTFIPRGHACVWRRLS